MRQLFIFLIIVTFSSCTQHIYMSVLEPAPVDIPSDIKKVGVINRSQPSEKSKTDVVDKVVSLEGKNLDKEGAEESIKGLKTKLLKNDRFNKVIIIDTVMKTPGGGIFPAALSWDKVNDLCDEYSVDAIFSLELFDTETKISYSSSPRNIKTPLGDVPALEHHANMLTTVTTGWRIYDPKGSIILDEYRMNDRLTFTGSGINPVKAASALLGRKEAVKRVSKNIGRAYATRIIPYYVRVVRDYFVKGNKKFKIAKRKARTGNWDGAAEIWMELTKSPKRKIAGRACMNVAIIEEMNGNLQKALEWAQKSYEEYNIRKALDYVNILENRIAKQKHVDWQMER